MRFDNISDDAHVSRLKFSARRAGSLILTGTCWPEESIGTWKTLTGTPLRADFDDIFSLIYIVDRDLSELIFGAKFRKEFDVRLGHAFSVETFVRLCDRHIRPIDPLLTNAFLLLDRGLEVETERVMIFFYRSKLLLVRECKPAFIYNTPH